MRWNAAHLALLLAALSATAAPARKTVAAKAPPADWQAGTARVDITPKWPLWMAGFAARTRPSEGVVAPVFAKALALEDKTGARFILITADLLGFVDAVSEEVAARVKTRHGIPRERIVFNASHTHWGPVIGRQLQAAYPMTSRQWADVDRYTADLTDQVTELVAEALRKLQPARITYSETTASFASNYRTKTDKGFIHKANPEGVVERLVPVMRVGGEKDAVLAVVFGYACHPTVATGEDRLYDFHGDYPGFAQAQLEREFLGSTDVHPGIRRRREGGTTRLFSALAEAWDGAGDAGSARGPRREDSGNGPHPRGLRPGRAGIPPASRTCRMGEARSVLQRERRPECEGDAG